MAIEQTVESSDSHSFSCFVAEPEGDALGTVVIVQEIFGCTQQLLNKADYFARMGYRAVLPALYDRIEPGLVIPYNEIDVARSAMLKLSNDQVLLDIDAVVNTADADQFCAVIGYCWGGAMAYLYASRYTPDCAVSFYGTRLVSYLDETPNCPVQFHFGEEDHHIPLADVETIASKLPDSPLYVYEGAGHAFANDSRPEFDQASCELAEQRMFEFFQSCRSQS